MIHVKYEVASTTFKIQSFLEKLSSYDIISFDTETQSIYTKEERKQADKLVQLWKKDKQAEAEYPRNEQKLIRQIAKSSGLSYPELVKVTHFIFGVSESFSYVIVCYDTQTELLIWNWLNNYKGKVVIHNALFDLKIDYHRTGKLLKDYDDTQLMAKILLNNADEFEGKTGLKHLMGSYYDPKWTMLDEDGYDVVDYKNEAFLRYSSIDGASVFLLYKMLKEEFNNITV